MPSITVQICLIVVMLKTVRDSPVATLSAVAVGVSLIDLMRLVPHEVLPVIVKLAPGRYHVNRQLYFSLHLLIRARALLPGGIQQLLGQLLVELLDQGDRFGLLLDQGGGLRLSLISLKSPQVEEVCPFLCGVTKPDQALAKLVLHLDHNTKVDEAVLVMEEDVLSLCEGGCVGLVSGVRVSQRSGAGAGLYL